MADDIKVGTEFESYKALTDSIKCFEERNFVNLMVRDTRSVEAAAKRNHRKSYNPAIKYSDISFCCTYGGKKNVSHSTGKRSHKSTKQSCPFSLKLRATVDGQRLFVREMSSKHNHPLDEAEFRLHPKQRKLDRSSEQEIASLLTSEPDKKILRKRIMEATGKVILMKDIHNIKTRLVRGKQAVGICKDKQLGDDGRSISSGGETTAGEGSKNCMTFNKNSAGKNGNTSDGNVDFGCQLKEAIKSNNEHQQCFQISAPGTQSSVPWEMNHVTSHPAAARLVCLNTSSHSTHLQQEKQLQQPSQSIQNQHQHPESSTQIPLASNLITLPSNKVQFLGKREAVDSSNLWYQIRSIASNTSAPPSSAILVPVQVSNRSQFPDERTQYQMRNQQQMQQQHEKEPLLLECQRNSVPSIHQTEPNPSPEVWDQQICEQQTADIDCEVPLQSGILPVQVKRKAPTQITDQERFRQEQNRPSVDSTSKLSSQAAEFQQRGVNFSVHEESEKNGSKIFTAVGRNYSGMAGKFNEALQPLAWLFGKWQSKEGKGQYPTIQPFSYAEEAEFTPIGMQPNIEYRFTSWNLSTNAPMHRETGYIKIKPGTQHIAFIAAHNFGIVDLQEGEVKDQQLEVATQFISRTSFNKDPAVKMNTRTLKLDGDRLEHMMLMQTANTDLTEHLRIVYTKA